MSTIRLWFVLPLGQALVGMAIGAIYGLLYRHTHAIPSRREIFSCGVFAMALFFWGDWFQYRNLVIEKDGAKIVVSEVLPFPEFFEFKFQGKRQLKFRGVQIKSDSEANPAYEKLMYGLGILLLSLAAGGIFSRFTTDQDYCEKCERYFKRVKSVNIKFSSRDELSSRLDEVDRLGFGTRESFSVLTRPFRDEVPEKRRELSLVLKLMKCSCDRRLAFLSVFIKEGNGMKEITALARKAELEPVTVEIEKGAAA